MYIVSFEHEALKILNFAPANFQGTLNKYQIENDTFDKIFTGRNISPVLRNIVFNMLAYSLSYEIICYANFLLVESTFNRYLGVCYKLNLCICDIHYFRPNQLRAIRHDIIN